MMETEISFPDVDVCVRRVSSSPVSPILEGRCLSESVGPWLALVAVAVEPEWEVLEGVLQLRLARSLRRRSKATCKRVKWERKASTKFDNIFKYGLVE